MRVTGNFDCNIRYILRYSSPTSFLINTKRQLPTFGSSIHGLQAQRGIAHIICYKTLEAVVALAINEYEEIYKG